MAFQNRKIIGLGAKRNFTDVDNPTNALNALNLSIKDLNIIKGSATAGVTTSDWISLSRLSTSLYKTLDRYYRETDYYTPIFQSRSGTSNVLLGNLSINGNISGRGIRYRYVVGVGTTASIQIADVSSSRVSSWNPSVVPSTITTPISYGARVGIITGGELRFGTPTTSSQIRFQTSQQPELREFGAEIPTHKIKCSIGGTTVYLYAMRGIPIIFTGTFRNLTPSVTLTNLVSGVKPGWKIQEVANPVGFSTFETTAGRTTSSISYRSTSLRERYIKFYYNPSSIRGITINGAKITTFSQVGLSTLSSLNLAINDIANFPDLNTFAPNLKILNLSRNPLYLSDTLIERRINGILSKIPTGLEELYLGQTFFGSLGATGTVGINSIAEKFPGLKVLNLGRPVIRGTATFHSDSFDPNGYLPNVPNTCETYSVEVNDFRNIGASSGSSKNIKECENLKSLDLSRNLSLADASFSIASDLIQSVNISNTSLPCPNMSGKTNLVSFYGQECNQIGFLTTTSGQYKFENCESLKNLYFNGSNLLGRFPTFANSNLENIELGVTNFTGGNTSGDENFVIHQETFQSCVNLKYLRLTTRGGNSTYITAPIHPNAFNNNSKLTDLRYSSIGRTTGNLPNLSSCPLLSVLIITSNSISGSLPSFASNPNIRYVDLSNNALTGSVLGYSNLLSLTDLYLFRNALTSINTFGTLPVLRNFAVNNNQISGTIPDFSTCTNLVSVNMSSNLFTSYFSGAFSKLLLLKFLDLSNNQLSQQAINAIVSDLLTNYNSANRGGVSINLKNNATPGSSSVDIINFLKLRGWTFIY